MRLKKIVVIRNEIYQVFPFWSRPFKDKRKAIRHPKPTTPISRKQDQSATGKTTN
jgi:hypothetical protein